MTETIDDIIARVPGFMQDNFARISAKETPVVGNTNHGELAVTEEVAEELEPIETVQPSALAHTGRITPGIFAERGDELSMWINNDGINVQFKCRSGNTYYGAPAPVLMAEGGFGTSFDAEDHAFVHNTLHEVVTAAKYSNLSAGDFNRAHYATALWTNMDRSGSAVARAFLVFTWGRIGGRYYPQDAILFDGDRTKLISIQQGERRNVRAPQYVGVVK